MVNRLNYDGFKNGVNCPRRDHITVPFRRYGITHLSARVAATIARLLASHGRVLQEFAVS